MARGTIWEPYIHDVVDADEAAIVTKHYPAFVRAYRKTPVIEGMPEEILTKIIERGVAAAADIARERRCVSYAVANRDCRTGHL